MAVSCPQSVLTKLDPCAKDVTLHKVWMPDRFFSGRFCSKDIGNPLDLQPHSIFQAVKNTRTFLLEVGANTYVFKNRTKEKDN